MVKNELILTNWYLNFHLVLLNTVAFCSRSCSC